MLVTNLPALAPILLCYHELMEATIDVQLHDSNILWANNHAMDVVTTEQIAEWYFNIHSITETYS